MNIILRRLFNIALLVTPTKHPSAGGGANRPTKEIHMPIILTINLKGGVAKTTNTVAIAECLASAGFRTLVIDADHQCMASELLLTETGLLRQEKRRKTLHDLLAALLDEDFGPAQFGNFITAPASNINGGIPRLSVIPCSFRIEDFSTNMAKARRGYHSTEEWGRFFSRRKNHLRNWLSESFDYTIIDCPPSFALQVGLFLSLGDAFIIPSVPDRLSVRGAIFLNDRLKARGFVIKGLGTLWSLFRTQSPLHRRIIKEAGKRVGPLATLPRPFDTIIPNATKIAEAAEEGQTPSSFRAKYTNEFGRLFEQLCQEIVQRSQEA